MKRSCKNGLGQICNISVIRFAMIKNYKNDFVLKKLNKQPPISTYNVIIVIICLEKNYFTILYVKND